jgi:hypothetical protein
LVRPVSGQNLTLQVIVGEDLTLSVSVSGFNLPITSITWTHRGSILTEEDRVTITNSPTLPSASSPVISTLAVTAITPANAGKYSVKAFNHMEQATLTFRVIVACKKNIEQLYLSHFHYNEEPSMHSFHLYESTLS